MNAAISKYVGEENLRGSLLLITALSWCLFPVLVNQMNPALFNAVFAAIFVIVITSVVIGLPRNQLVLQPIHKVMLISWAGYLLMLLLATVESASMHSMAQWCILAAKFIFFVFLLFYLSEKFIVRTLRLYANIMVAVVMFSVLAVCVAAIGIQPLTTFNLHGTLTNFYFGTYYDPHFAPICMPFPISRVQGLNDEPGDFALALLPAFFYLLVGEKAYKRAAVIALGLCLTMSVGAALILLVLLFVMTRSWRRDYKVPAIFVGVIGMVGLMYVFSSSCQTSYLESLFKTDADGKDRMVATDGVDRAALISLLTECTKSRSQSDCVEYIQYNIASSANGKVHSFKDRLDGLRVASGYLSEHVMGTGAALGMPTVNAISVGTSTSANGIVVAVLEAGVVGGVFYLCLFATMGWLAIKTIVTTDPGSYDARVKVVVALSVCAVIVMGLQRIQPDITLWHMWIYAMFFHVMQHAHGPSVETKRL